MTETLPDIICNEAQSIVAEEATLSGDGFRQWVYPKLPTSYAMNDAVRTEIYAEMIKGKSAVEIGRILYERHS